VKVAVHSRSVIARSVSEQQQVRGIEALEQLARARGCFSKQVALYSYRCR